MAIQWRDQPILDSVQLPGSDTKYWVADAEAREQIETLVNATHFLGVTTTVITDGSTTQTVVINGESRTANSGDIVIYNAGTELAPENKEFIWNGNAWQEFGDPAIHNLGTLAYKNSASGDYTPKGTIDIVANGQASIAFVPNPLSFGVSISTSEPTQGYTTLDVVKSITVDTDATYVNEIDWTIDTGTINYISSLTSPSNILTGNISSQSYNVVSSLNEGTLPTISNTNTITATMGTGSSSTTLIFSLSDIGFNAGSFPSASYGTVLGLGSETNVSVGTISYDTSELVIVTNVSAELLKNRLDNDISVVSGIGIKANLTGITVSQIAVAYTAAFAGTPETITVS